MTQLPLWPENQQIPLYDEDTANLENEGVCTITPYWVDEEVRASVVIFPGGGYAKRAYHEGEPVAKWFNSIGYHSFVVSYRVFPYRHPAPLYDAKQAIRFVRSRANQFHLNPEQIGAVGFSAGGHLAACTAVYANEMNEAAAFGTETVSARPDFCILCYPVISMKQYAHVGSRENLVGRERNLIEKMSLEDHIPDGMPPIFIWHTEDDATAPVAHSLIFAQRCQEKGAPCELVLFPSGRHGLGLADEHPEVQCWKNLCQHWMKKILKD